MFCASAASVVAQESVAAQQQTRIQGIVDHVSGRLGITDAVLVSIVPSNRLLMSVEPGEHAFQLKVEDGFADTLDDAELAAAVAHELGHVWIFTHHPFLQTEQLANEVAMRLVSRDVLAVLYDKVWRRVGFKGDLDRFLGPMPVRGLASPEAQPAQPAPVEFEVVSIKRSAPDATGGGIQSTPDGGFVMRNSPIRSIILAGSPVPAREVAGFPDWVVRENYDITAKAPAGTAPRQRPEMMRRMLEARLKLKGHVEERERTVFALVPARSDGQLGPQLKPSSLDCAALGARAGGAPPSGPAEGRCGGAFGNGQIVSGGIQMDQLVLSLSGLAGGQVINRTGLQGYYALTLRFAPRGAADREPTADGPPEFFTAVQEQLGLKLQPEKAKVPIFIVDSIERPSEN